MAVKKQQTIDWIHILNEQTIWTCEEDVRSWCSSLTARELKVSDAVVSDFQTGLNELREVLQDLHFQRIADLSPLQRRIANVKLGFQQELGALPLFRAFPVDGSDEALLLSLGDTALVQFCSYTGEVLAGRPLDLYRCEGLFRENMKGISPVKGLTPGKELEWRCEIPILLEADLQESTDVHRCADFFLGGKGKFCSDACRFATFQLIKQLKDPEYLAEKQRRYRARSK